jgi:pSer/pThr/pTyr-binding forkhead associated (FHA) protein
MTAGRLYWVQRDGNVAEIPMSKPRLVVGRASDCDVRLQLPSVSSHHVAITRSASAVTVEDLGSTNGTKVNGRKIENLQLKHGDQIEIGTERLVFFTDASLPPAQFDRLAQNAPKGSSQGPNTEKISSSTHAPPQAVPRMQNEPRTQIAASADGSTQRAATIPLRAAVTIMSGKMSGRKFPITKDTTTLGQEGAQIFQIVLRDGAYWVVRGLQSASPTVNGHEVGDRGLRLAHNDLVELAGASVRFEIEPG